MPAVSKLVQRVEATPYTTYTSFTTTIPFDDTIPQNTEGTEIITVAITPTNVSNRLKIYLVAPMVNGNAGGTTVVAALFRIPQQTRLRSAGNNRQHRSNAPHRIHLRNGGGYYFVHNLQSSVRNILWHHWIFERQHDSKIFGGVSAVRLWVEEIAV